MDQQTIRVLEFDKVLACLAERCASSLGKDLAMQLRPSINRDEIAQWQQETSEAVHLLELGDRVPLGGLHDIRSAVTRARTGGLLTVDQLLIVADTCRCARLLRHYILTNIVNATNNQDSILAYYAADMSQFQSLEQQIEHCISPDGEVKDTASTVLARIRKSMRVLQSRIRDKLESIIRSSQASRVLQDSIVTMRNGRYVVPVKQEYRAAMPGIVHDQSGSGATLFVEPMPVVEMNNQLRELESQETEEIERILQELCTQIGNEAEAIIRTVDIAGQMDMIFAKARLALDWHCNEPVMNKEGWLDIRRARHPLLKGNVVPIDLSLGRDFKALVITGPNTGGKTVTLKTVGLFALMYQAGLHLPAGSGTQMVIYDSIYADIGDEQSIEQNLSTFSSHMVNIVNILRRVSANSLVLLDELGAGTDPTEGAALAMSILEYLLNVGCQTVATTHYSELKAFAYTQAGAENASVEFDVETLQPTYRLTVGVAGSSNAFAIANRLGLSEAVISRAQSHLTREHVKVEDLIREVEEDRRLAAEDREKAKRLREEYQALRDKYEQALAKWQSSQLALMEEARSEAAKLLSSARNEVADLIGALRKAGQTDQNELENVAREARARIEERQADIESQRERESTAVKSSATPALSINKGDFVHIRSLGLQGEVLSEADAGGSVLVQAGAIRVSLPVTDLQRVEQQPRAEVRSGYTKLAHSKSTSISPELDLRGFSVDEALAAVDKYIDDCLLTGLAKARIIHGKGTGALRQAVRTHLREMPQIRSFRYGEHGEGGDGVTVVEL